jgi:hypothetical protein
VAQKVSNFSQKLERSPLGLPGRFAKAVEQSGAYAVTNPIETGNIVIDKIKEAARIGSDLGRTAALPLTQKSFQESHDINSRQADLFTRKAVELSQSGDKAGAQQYFKAAQDILTNNANEANKRVSGLETEKQNLQQSGTSLANIVGAVANPAAAVKTVLGGGALNTMIKAAVNQSNPKDFLEGMESAADYAGFVNITNPAIAGLVGKYTSGIANPVTQNLLARTLSAAGNLVEDRGLSTIYKEDRNIYDDLLSLGVGFIMQSGGEVKDYDVLKKELSSFGLTKQDSDAVAESFQLAKSRLQKEVKYKELRTGAVVPVYVSKNMDMANGVGRDFDPVLTREDAISRGYKVLSPEEEVKFRVQKSQGGFIGTPEEKVLGKAEATLPQYLSKAKPRYNYGQKAFIPQFESDIDKALYITAQTTKSQNDEAYREFLRKQGFTDESINSTGQLIRNKIKEEAAIRDGGDYQDPEIIPVPATAVKPEVQPGIQEPIAEPQNLNETLASQPNQIAPDAAAQAEMDSALKTGSTQDIVEGAKPVPEEPQTAQEVFNQQMKAFQEQQQALRENAQNTPTEPVVNPMVEDAATKVFGEAPAEPAIPLKNQQLRKTYTSMMESDTISSQYKNEYLKDRPDRYYDIKGNKESIDNAFATIDREGQQAVGLRFLNDGIDINNPDDMATAIVLHKMLEDQGDRQGASSLLGTIFDKATKAGQSAQMLALIDKMGPSSMVDAAQNYIEGGISKKDLIEGKVYDALGNVLKKFGVKLGLSGDAVETRQEAGNFLESLKTKFDSLKTEQEKKDFLDVLISKNKRIEKTLKNKTNFIDKIIKISQDPQAN